MRESFDGSLGCVNVVGPWYLSAVDEQNGFGFQGDPELPRQGRPVCPCVLEDTVLPTS